MFIFGNSKRDWGHAKDFVEAQWLILQKDKPDDYVISTGIQYSVRDFICEVAKNLDMELVWHGSGLDEYATWNGKKIIMIDKRYFRPTEVDTLLGDFTKAKKELNWSPKIDFKSLVKEMTDADFTYLSNLRND